MWLKILFFVFSIAAAAEEYGERDEEKALPRPDAMANNFNSFGAWKQQINDKFDWTIRSGCTPSSSTGPCAGHGGSGSYAYIETSSPRVQGDSARLNFKASNSDDLCMTFYYHMYGQTVGTLNVFNDNKKVFSRSGALGNTWNVAHIDLSGDLDIVIEGIRGSSYTGDIAIDDISVARRRCNVPTPSPPINTVPPQTGGCGKRPVTSRIVGGTQAPVNSWPWQAMLTSSSGRQFCGGTLVHPQFVVTASHCVVGKSASSIKIRMGAHYRLSGSVGTEQDIPVAQIITHPQYHSPLRYSNDIAVIKLARPAVLGKGVSTICMPRDDLPLPLDDPGKKCYITGWGTLAAGGSQPNHLMQASVPLVSKARCLKGYPGKIHDSMLCAGLDQGGVDACQGDSGGPLVCEYNGRWHLEGATSWGYGCAAPMKYGVYALVRYNRAWVQKVMGLPNPSSPTPPAPQTPPAPSTPPMPPQTPNPPTPGQCGVSSVTRVIAGVNAQPGAWPWQIGLHRNNGFICGGSLIKRDWVVTAAHCVTYNNPSAYFVRLGDHNRQVQEGTEQDIKVVRIISHPNYNNPRLSNDIALIQLAKPATLNSRVGLACLPNQDYDLPAGSNCYITGWGKIKHPGSSHHILQQAHMPSIDHAECKRKNGNIGITITDVMLCGGKANTQISGCHGDSGGPYVCKNSTGRWVLQGDVSWGNPQCDSTQKYTVFGRVAKFRNWIDMHTLGGTPPPPLPPTQPPTPQPPTQPPSQSMNTNFNTLGSWKQATNDKFDWTLNSGSTSSSSTGPSSDHTGSGKYAYIETSSPRVSGDNARLTFSGSSNGPLCMTFYYHMYGNTIGSLKVYDNGVVVLTLSGNKGNAWFKQQVDLSSDRNVMIEGVRGSSYTGDIAIDDISVTRGRCASTAPPTPPIPGTPPLPSQTPGQCGVSSVTRVIAGVDAQPGAWPWQIGLHRNNRFICGGSLIKRDWVVTAAHCVTYNNPSAYFVRLGDHNRQVQEGTEQDIKVVRIISHPNYNNPQLSSDIALIQLAKPATLNSRVGLACLPNQDYDLPAGSNCYITGWGKIKHPGSSHHILQQAHMPSIDHAECKRKNGNTGITVTDVMLCGGKANTQISGCHGDSGGPYVCKNSAGRWVLQGDVSWGNPQCDSTQKYTVFGRVAKFRNWIDMHTLGGTPPPPLPPTQPPTPQPPTQPPSQSMNTNFNTLGSWKQATNDKFDWTLNSGSTSSSSTGPSSDHTGSGKYAYIETSSPRVSGDNARLTFSGSSNGPLCMTFYYHMYGNTIGSLKVYDNGVVVLTLSGNKGNAWFKQQVDLSSDRNVMIEGVRGSSYTGDIAIDDISVTRGRCASTAPPTPPIPGTPPLPSQTPGQCGVSSVTRVIAGVDAQPGAWPWQIGLHRNNRFICGGSLIKRDWVVTAAHCVTYNNPSAYFVRLGDHNRQVQEGTEQDIKVVRIISHPNYNNPQLSSDIALIQLAKPATLNSRVGLACLPNQDYDLPAGSNCYITGWGKIKHPGSSHHILQQAHMPSIDHAECKRKNGNTGITVTDVMLCGGKANTQISGCHGDSGGPYVCKNSAGRWVLQGDVSWGNPQCDSRQRYTVFGRVAKFRNWIDMHTLGGTQPPPKPTPPPTPPPPTQPPTPPPPTQPPTPPPPSQSMNTNFNTLGSWKQATNDKFDWTLNSGSTSSSSTGPSSDHTGSGKYAYIETSSPRVSGDNARLTFSGSSNGPLCMTFYYHMYGNTIGSLKVYDNGVVVLTLTGNMGNAWFKQQVDLSNDRNVMIEGVRGSSYTGDIAIDDISVTRGRCASTAPPTPPIPGTPPLPSQTPGQCGVSSVTRVIAGVDAQPGAWPWQIGLHRNNGFICGGSLIKRDWVVTAAHCVTYNNPSAYFVRLGDHNRQVQEGTEQDIKVVRIISHPNYNNPRLSNDIALIQLAKPATLNSRVGLACLPNQDYDLPAGSNCYITGWGKIKHPGSSHHILQQAHMPSIDHAECKRKNGNTGITVTDVMLCGGKANTQISGCHGDSGGPYVCKNSAGRWVLQGDVSWGNPQCDSRQRYTVFGRVAKFRNWIDMHTLGGTPPPSLAPTQPPSQSMNTNFNTLGSWKQATNDKFDWTLNSGSTSSSSTGPSSDHTGSGKYAYIETSSPRVSGDNARLTFSGSSNGPLCMTFYYHMYGNTIGSLKVYDNGVVVLTLSGNKGNAWFKQQVDLSNDRNVMIEGVRGSSYTGDIAIDDISVTRGRCASTAPPTPPIPGTPPLPSQTPNLSCGKRPVTSRIVGGTQALVNSWPWQAMLTSSSGRQFCGGTLVHPQFVVTASHCVVGKSASSIKIRMGAHYRLSGSVGTEQDIPVAQITTHPQYHSPLRYSNDIAVIKLARPAVLGKGVSTICMPRDDLPLPLDDPGKKCYITGWGTLAAGGSQPNHLMQASVPLVSKARCLKGYPGKIHDSMLCAGLDQGGVDACQGDSGGPLVCEYNGRWHLEGATSWGYGCAAPMKYGVYALVRYNRAWVQKVMGV